MILNINKIRKFIFAVRLLLLVVVFYRFKLKYVPILKKKIFITPILFFAAETKSKSKYTMKIIKDRG